MAQGESKEANYEDILGQIVQRLIDQVKGANEATCYFSLDPDTLPSNPGDHVYVVAPVSGQFREGAFVGGGVNFLATHSGCLVKIHCASLVDQKLRDAQAIMERSFSVLRKASAVLNALAPSTADNPAQSGWVPRLGDYDLTSPFVPTAYSLHKSENQAIRAIELAFGFQFDWDTSQAQD